MLIFDARIARPSRRFGVNIPKTRLRRIALSANWHLVNFMGTAFTCDANVVYYIAICQLVERGHRIRRGFANVLRRDADHPVSPGIHEKTVDCSA